MQLLLIVNVVLCLLVLNAHGNAEQENRRGKLGNPLILTPLIKQGKIAEARRASEVTHREFGCIKSYSGLFTVDELFNSNLFFWFFPSQRNSATDPVIVYLQGGPGVSSLVGLFVENGPFVINFNGSLTNREYSWTQNYSVIYIDNPVGVGYSFTTDGGYTRNETIVGQQLYNAVLQFFQVFPELKNNDFFVSGESYAAKFVPALGYAIHKNNPLTKHKINLQGMIIGSAYCDPVHQSDYSDNLYAIGLIDSNDRIVMRKIEQEGIRYILDKQWQKAYNLFSRLIGDPDSLFTNITGFSNTFSFLVPKITVDIFPALDTFLQRNDVRRAIHVGNTPYVIGSALVEQNLQEDTMQSVAPWVSELLSHYKILAYNGQLDIIVSYASTLKFLRNLDFRGADVYETAKRQQWLVDNELAGYIKVAENLTEVFVLNAGHTVILDQPRRVLDLLSRFTRKQTS